MDNRTLYLDLLKKSLTDLIYEPMTRARYEGTDPHLTRAHTMIGIRRLDNIHECFDNIVKDNIEGDLIEAGVWRGGATIFMAGLTKAYGEDRTVFVADSFEGLPKPDEQKYPADQGDMHWTYKDLSISFDEVKSNFEAYDLLCDNVKFLKGWFKDTLPTVQKPLSMIRLDGDMYQSTWESLENLYKHLSVGGYVIADDWLLKGARRAIEDFRLTNNIYDDIQYINEYSVFWRKS
jgi:O-methyltransferase